MPPPAPLPLPPSSVVVGGGTDVAKLLQTVQVLLQFIGRAFACAARGIACVLDFAAEPVPRAGVRHRHGAGASPCHSCTGTLDPGRVIWG